MSGLTSANFTPHLKPPNCQGGGGEGGVIACDAIERKEEDRAKLRSPARVAQLCHNSEPSRATPTPIRRQRCRDCSKQGHSYELQQLEFCPLFSNSCNIELFSWTSFFRASISAPVSIVLVPSWPLAENRTISILGGNSITFFQLTPL